MTHLQIRLMDSAKQKYGRIRPCGNTGGWERCFTVLDGRQLFWFNTTNGSTHVFWESKLDQVRETDRPRPVDF